MSWRQRHFPFSILSTSITLVEGEGAGGGGGGGQGGQTIHPPHEGRLHLLPHWYKIQLKIRLYFREVVDENRGTSQYLLTKATFSVPATSMTGAKGRGRGSERVCDRLHEGTSERASA